jgi:hypothetical protein
MEVSGQLHTPATLSPEKEPLAGCVVHEVGLDAVQKKSLALAGSRPQAAQPAA